MMMSIARCTALTHNHFLLSRFVTLSRQPTSLQFQSPSSLRLPPIRSPPPFNQLRFRHSRLSTLSDDSSGGIGGTGDDGGWNSGDNESDDGGGKWSFLSCIAKKSEPMSTLAPSVWWVFGYYWTVVVGQQFREGVEQFLEEFLFLFCLLAVFPAIAEVFIIFYIGMACLVLFTILCTIPIEALANASRTREGASEDDIRSLPMYRFRQSNVIREGVSEDDIRSLPMYRFSQSNVMVMVDDNKKQFLKARTGSYNQSHTSELSLHPDDSVSTNCVFF